MREAVEQFRAAIAAAGLLPPALIVPDGNLHRFPTNGRVGDDAGWYVLHGDALPAGAFGDWRTGLSLTWRAGGAVVTRPCRPVVAWSAPRDRRRTDAALALWEAAAPADGTLVERYLAARRLHLEPPASLRFHASLRHPTAGRWPAMLALVTRGADAAPVALHRTFLARDGRGKAPVQPCRLMLGPCRGGAVRLAASGKVTLVGEGIETCLAAMQASGLPAWAALSTSGMRTLELPAELRDVIILADGDPAGESAAQAAGLRWKRQGRRVRIARPPRGMDFNDLLLGRAP